MTGVRRDFLLRFVRAGLWPGMPFKAAEQLTAAGIDTAADVTASALVALPGVGSITAPRLAKALADRIETHDVALILDLAELSLRVAGRLAKDLGPGAGQALRSNPWRVLVLPDLDLAEADRLAAALGHGADDPSRGPAVIGYVLARAARAGHTASTTAQVLREAALYRVPDPRSALDTALDSGAVVASEGDLLALERYARAEADLARGLLRLAESAENWLPDEGPPEFGELDEAQRSAVAGALARGVSILTGGPGTGKSRTVAALVGALTELSPGSGRRLALAAPTGRAAKRLEELSGAPATTLHRLLGAQGTTGVYLRDATWPLEAELVVVDETSMLDTELAAALVNACADGTHLLLVGDPAQLPSIGAGRVLGDLLDSERFPATALSALYRHQAGGTIARLATEVRAGVLPAVDDPSREVVITPARDSGQAAHRVVQLVTDSIPRALGIDAADVQVVTPVHRGPAGTRALNQVLKAALNPGPGAHRGFDPGDRVVALANRPDSGFSNGDVGVVQGAGEHGGLIVAFTAGAVTVPRDAVSDLVLGFAITVHRAQGSEWPALVVVVPPESAGMLSRPLIYTAITRAQRHLSVVPAVGPALPRAVAAVGEQPRTTRLAALLKAARAETAAVP